MQTPPDSPPSSEFDPEILALVEPDAVLMVVDVQSRVVQVKTLVRTADGFEPEGRAIKVDGFGPELDDELLNLVVAQLDTPLPAVDDPDAAAGAAVRRLLASVRRARLRLADEESTAVAARLGGTTTVVTIERRDFQEAIRPQIERVRPRVDGAMATAENASNGWVVAVFVSGDAVIAPVLAATLADDSPIPVFVSGIGLLTPSTPQQAVADAAGATASRSPATGFWDRLRPQPSQQGRSLVFALWPVAAAVAALFLVSSAGFLGALDVIPTGTARPDVVARPSASPGAAPATEPPATSQPTPTPTVIAGVAAPPAAPPVVVHVRSKSKKKAPAVGSSAGSGRATSGDTTTPSPDPTDTTDPGTGDPGTGDPGTGDPGTGDPGTGDPGTGDPGTGDPGTGDPGTGDPGTGDPGNPVDPGIPVDPGPGAPQ